MQTHRKLSLSASASASAGGLLALLLACGGPVQPAAGHAVMVNPPSRPWLDYLANYNYLPHQVFAGGTMKYSKNETLKYPNLVRSGVCGDAVGETHWSKPGPIPANATYKEGGIVTVDIVFAQNHLGRWRMRLCPLDATDEAKQCTDLQRADGKGRTIDLPMTEGWHGVTVGFIAPDPAEVQDRFELFPMPPVTKADGCAAWACDQFKDMFVYRSEWRLPKGFTCAHCSLQMEYMTASRCWPRCEPDAADCIDRPPQVNYKYCGEDGASYPELFWNCADIAVVKGDGKQQQKKKSKDKPKRKSLRA